MHIKNSTLISKTIHVLFTDSYVYCFYQFATFWYIFIVVVFKIATYVFFFFLQMKIWKYIDLNGNVTKW